MDDDALGRITDEDFFSTGLVLDRGACHLLYMITIRDPCRPTMGWQSVFDLTRMHCFTAKLTSTKTSSRTTHTHNQLGKTLWIVHEQKINKYEGNHRRYQNSTLLTVRRKCAPQPPDPHQVGSIFPRVLVLPKFSVKCLMNPRSEMLIKIKLHNGICFHGWRKTQWKVLR